MDRYLAALAAHDPARVPLAANIRATENEQVVAPGDGLWGTITGLGHYRHVFADPEAGQVAAFVGIEEQGQPELANIRLKVRGGRVVEAETLVVRGRDFNNPNLPGVKPIFSEVVAPGKRLSRAELIRITNLYFEAIEKDSGDVAPFHPECNRTENGIQTTNNPKLAVPGATEPATPSGCREQIDSGIFSYITQIDPRRFLVVDTTRNLVYGMFMFRHDGRLTQVTGKDGKVRKMFPSAMRPFNVEVSELFKIEDGKIREIEAVMTELPYRTPSAWAGKEAR